MNRPCVFLGLYLHALERMPHRLRAAVPPDRAIPTRHLACVCPTSTLFSHLHRGQQRVDYGVCHLEAL